MASTQSLLDWQGELLTKVFFQADDKVAADAMDEVFSKELQVTINGARLDYSSYTEAIKGARAAHKFELLDVETLLMVENPKDGATASGGSVAQKTRFSEQDASGKIQLKVLVGITVIDVEEGNRKIVQMTEVESDTA